MNYKKSAESALQTSSRRSVEEDRNSSLKGIGYALLYIGEQLESQQVSEFELPVPETPDQEAYRERLRRWLETWSRRVREDGIPREHPSEDLETK